MWAYLTFHQIETLKSSQVHSWALGELNNPIIHILLSKDTWHQITQKKHVKTGTMISEKEKKDFGHVQAMLSGSSLLKEHDEVSIFTLKNKVLAILQVWVWAQLFKFKKFMVLGVTNLFFPKFNNLWVQFHVHITHSFLKVKNYRDESFKQVQTENCGIKFYNKFKLKIVVSSFTTSSNLNFWKYWILQEIKID